MERYQPFYHEELARCTISSGAWQVRVTVNGSVQEK